MKKIKVTLIFLLGFLITSCGFHLRGNQDLSAVLPDVKIVGTSKHSDLGRELVRALTSAKVSVLDESEIILKVTRDNFSKRVLSLDNTGRANQYELNYQLAFSLVKKVQQEGQQKLVDMIPAQSIFEKREYLFDANLILAKADEENRLNNDMRQAAMLQLIRRLTFSLKSRNKASQ